ncbi:MAG: hypothetical protein K0R55_269 [Sporomusa sp.]|nr:hypothetical protein [Sporomusa sp.]
MTFMCNFTKVRDFLRNYDNWLYFNPHSIKYQLQVTLIALCVISVFFTGTLSIWSMYHKYKDQLVSKNLIMSKMLGDQLDIYMNNAKRVLTTTAYSSSLKKGNYQDIKQEMDLAYNNYHYFDLITYTDKDLTMTFSNPESKVDKKILLNTIGERDYFKGVVKSRSPYVSDLYISEGLAIPHFTIAGPVYNNGAAIGVLGGGVSLIKLEDVVKRSLGYFDGNVCVFDNNGNILIDTKKKEIRQIDSIRKVQIKVGNELKTIGEYIDQNQDIIAEMSEDNEKKFLSISFSPDYRWGVIVEQDASVVYKEIYALILEIIGILVLIIIIFIFIGIIFGDIIVKPIENLVTAVGNMKNDSHILEKQPFNLKRSFFSYHEIKELEQAFEMLDSRIKNQEEELIRNDRAKILGHFFAAIIHNIGNPLAGITNLLELLKDEKSDKSRREIVGLIRQEIMNLNQIILNFLEFGKTNKIRIAQYDVIQIMDSAIKLFSHELASKNTSITKEYENYAMAALVDNNGIQQVFINILKNSIESIQQNGVIKISISYCSEGIAIHFEDNGEGMKKEDLAKVLEPFYTKKSDGHGLGLFIVDKIIRQHGGQLRIDSKINSGTSVDIVLPTFEDHPNTEPFEK